MAAVGLSSLEHSAVASASGSVAAGSGSVVAAAAAASTAGSASGTTTLSASRARRRPARYSPEPITPNSASSNNNSQNALTLQQQLVSANGTLHDLGAHDASSQHAQQLMLQQQEHESSEESNGALVNGEMAPAAAVAPTRRAKHRTKRRYNKKRQRTGDDGGKRPRVANVLLENEQIIDEIRARKALWMRTHEQHHSSLLTAPLWEEIATTLETSHENIRRRWKSLKDHYRRELKKFMTDPTAPPSTWPYYKKMRFMKSQMFVSLRRKNGEDHLEILSDDEEDLNNQWNGQVIRSKVENDSDTVDGYELNQNYDEMVKYEQHLQQLNQNGEMDGQEDEEEEEEDEQQQQQDEQEEQEEQDPISPISSLHEQEALQQQAEMSNMSSLTRMQPQPVITSDIAAITTMVNGVPATIVTTASGNMSAQHCEQLASRLNAMQQQQQQQQHHMNAGMQRGQPREIPQEEEEEEDDNLAEMNARHSQLTQQQASINNQLNDIQRRAEMTALHQRANITAMHRNAEISTMQHRAEMQQQRNGGLDSTSGVEISDDRGAISDDYHFFMSLMPHVKNFSSLQKLKMRNRIQQIIIEEASNGPQYDPLANC